LEKFYIGKILYWENYILGKIYFGKKTISDLIGDICYITTTALSAEKPNDTALHIQCVCKKGLTSIPTKVACP